MSKNTQLYCKLNFAKGHSPKTSSPNTNNFKIRLTTKRLSAIWNAACKRKTHHHTHTPTIIVILTSLLLGWVRVYMYVRLIVLFFSRIMCLATRFLRTAIHGCGSYSVIESTYKNTGCFLCMLVEFVFVFHRMGLQKHEYDEIVVAEASCCCRHCYDDGQRRFCCRWETYWKYLHQFVRTPTEAPLGANATLKLSPSLSLIKCDGVIVPC